MVYFWIMEWPAADKSGRAFNSFRQPRRWESLAAGAAEAGVVEVVDVATAPGGADCQGNTGIPSPSAAGPREASSEGEALPLPFPFALPFPFRLGDLGR